MKNLDFLSFIQLSAKREAKLFCRYRHNNHPYLILQPAKEEQILDEPAIFLFHDVVSDKDIQEIKAIAMPRVCIQQKRENRIDSSNKFSLQNYNLLTYKILRLIFLRKNY